MKLPVRDASYTGGVQTRCLSFHAAYRCRHTGECCRAGWDVEVEPHIVEAVRTGRILPVLSTSQPFQPLNDGHGVAPARTRSGDCGFHHEDRCSLHQAGAETMLPSACRHFPRIYLRDARGTLLTLSHFCPTAAALLFEPGDVRTVDAPVPLALDEPIEGLDARDALPPLVRPGLLADIDGYAAWEALAVRTCVDSPSAAVAIGIIEAATERVRCWKPSDGRLSSTVRRAFDRAPAGARTVALSLPFSLVRELTGPHPLLDVPADFDAGWERVEHAGAAVMQQPVGRYLAASTFANWIAYRGEGLRSIVAWLRACHDVFRVQLVRRLNGADRQLVPEDIVEAVRMADYIMVHTVDSLAFGRRAAALET